MKGNTGARAKKFIMRGLVGILESPPPAHVVDQDCIELRFTTDDFLQQPAETFSVFDDYTRFTGIFVRLYDFKSILLGILLNPRFWLAIEYCWSSVDILKY